MPGAGSSIAAIPYANVQIALGVVRVRQDGAIHTRVDGVWAPGQAAPWWLATDLPDPLADLVARYDRRMTVEEPCRDTKSLSKNELVMI
jgi:hypothetical protein